MFVSIEAIAFEWSEAKRQEALKKHRIDFLSAVRIFENPVLEVLSPRGGEFAVEGDRSRGWTGIGSRLHVPEHVPENHYGKTGEER